MLCACAEDSDYLGQVSVDLMVNTVEGNLLSLCALFFFLLVVFVPVGFFIFGYG